ncbi:dimethylarginine dimethylaminohydrolase family protein [Clostridium tyrobutyricum]|jgi:N-dimethylarginine dimethylaminohydrolase|uniref:dimethylarginine dimethylaminohydrolase family protein n=1 Tax=Clostridium tyrobutyricum TaxID=1519 RepID=UPI00189D7850|nr:arginine deiminase family protein [Clostridium tyrobutyricum]
MINRVCIENEYGKLKKVVLGIAPTLYFPGSHEIEMEDESPWWKKVLTKFIYPVLERKKVPDFIVKKYQNELKNLKEVLISHGVEIINPKEVFCRTDETAGLGQMFSRDPVFCIGNHIIAGNLQIEMRRKELRGFSNILSDFQKFRAAGNLNEDSFLEGGDVIVDYPYVYVGIGKYASNEKGLHWLENQVGQELKVIPVYLKNEGILHLDCCMTLIGEKQGIIHPNSLQKPLPYPLNTYNFIEVDDKTRSELGTNVLMLDPTTIIVQKRHKELQQELRSRGFNVIPLDFTWHARLDGAFRCVTCPIYRE